MNTISTRIYKFLHFGMLDKQVTEEKLETICRLHKKKTLFFSKQMSIIYLKYIQMILNILKHRKPHTKINKDRKYSKRLLR
jgi:hypothetical protein